MFTNVTVRAIELKVTLLSKKVYDASSPIAKAAGSGSIPDTPTRAAGVHSSIVSGTLAGYIHNISLIKCKEKRYTGLFYP